MATQDGWSQANTREAMEYVDQHGRTFRGYGDIKAKLHPCTGLSIVPTVVNGVKIYPPWMPSESYAKFSTKNPTQFVWDYDAMLADGRKAEKERENLLFQAAAHFNVPNWDPSKDPPTPQMLRDVGDGPLPLDPIKAAKAGNGFILGLRPFDPSKPGDVKLKAALDKFAVNTHRNDDGAEYADDAEEFAEEEPEEIPEPKARRRHRRTSPHLSSAEV